MTKRKKIIVVGAGVGGSAVAALLAKRGHEVLVLEKNAFPGGRAATFERDGFIYDFGIHYAARGQSGPLGAIAEELQADLKWLHRDPTLLAVAENTVRIPLNLGGLEALYCLGRSLGVKAAKLGKAARVLAALTWAHTPEAAAAYDEIPLLDYLSRYFDDPRLLSLFSYFGGIFFVLPTSTVSTGEFMYALSKFLGDGSPSYPQGGFWQIAASYLRALGRDGGAVIYETPVRKIKVKGGRVDGVETGDRFYPADIVISNTGLKETIALVGEEHFPLAYVQQAHTLKPSMGAVGIKYALDKKIFEDPVVLYMHPNDDAEENVRLLRERRLPKHIPIFGPVPSNVDPNLAPPGKQLFIVGSIAMPGLDYVEFNREYIEALDAQVESLFPEIKRHTLWKIYTNVDNIAELIGKPQGEVVGLGQTYQQVGRRRPRARTPVEGLLLVGADTAGRGIGTEMAGDSARQVAAMLA